jgi:predicted Ser/Thr protein kinase
LPQISDNGRYVLGEVLGSGGQGQVFDARQLDLDRRVAIKLLYEAGQIRHEARILASLRHPNLVAVHELIEVEGRPALVMEHIDGPNLHTLMNTADIDADTTLKLWFAVVEGVAHAHRSGVIHGDLSPANVLIEVVDGIATPKICDFGVARSAADPLGASGCTVGFVAPERRDGAEPTKRSDVYSLAAIGRFLMPNGASDSIDQVLSLCMSPEPAARPEDAGALAREVGLHGHPLPIVGAPTRTARAPFAVLASLVLGASIITLFAYTLTSPEADYGVDPTLVLAAMERWPTQPAEAAGIWHAAGVPVPPQARAIGADSLVLPHDRTVTQVAPQGQHLVTADEDGVVREWDLDSGTVIRTVRTVIIHPVHLAAAGDRFTMTAT